MIHVASFREYHKLNESLEGALSPVMLREDFNSTMTVLKNAIQNKFVCTIYYRGERKGMIDDGYRYIEPYAWLS